MDPALSMMRHGGLMRHSAFEGLIVLAPRDALAILAVLFRVFGGAAGRLHLAHIVAAAATPPTECK